LPIKIKIIIDNQNPNKRRTSFWKLLDINNKKDKYRIDYISILDLLESDNPFEIYDLFNNNKTDVIIISWDSVNNDPVYGSDMAYRYFDHYRVDQQTFVENGGIIILEAQAAAMNLVQDAYDIFAENIKIIENCQTLGDKAKINTNLSHHPILKEIEAVELPKHGPFDENDWFPKNAIIYTQEIVKQDYIKRRLYNGWFSKITNDWEPLIFTDDGKNPIMICRLEKGSDKELAPVGGFILTTMYIGSSGLTKLIDNLLCFHDEISGYYKRKRQIDIERTQKSIKKEQKVKKGQVIRVGSLFIIIIVSIILLVGSYDTITSDKINIINFIQNYLYYILMFILALLTFLFGNSKYEQFTKWINNKLNKEK
jgi:hypothetical protein